MPALTLSTLFGPGDTVFVKIEAEKNGKLVSGKVGQVVTHTPGDVSDGATGATVVLYSVAVAAAFAPPQGLFREDLLVSESAAKALAVAYHTRRAASHTETAQAMS